MTDDTRGLVDLLAGCDPLAFPELLRMIHARRYTGRITLNFLAGVPTVAELPNDPVQVRLSRGAAPTPVLNGTPPALQ